MRKVVLDQTMAWLLAAALGVVFFGGVYLLTKHKKNFRGEELAPKPEAESHKAEAAPSESSDKHTEKKDDHHSSAKEQPAASSGAGLHEPPVSWGYSGSEGPEFWGRLAEKFSACSSGRQQSPVNLVGPKTNGKLLPLHFFYKRSDVVLKNEQATVRADIRAGNYLEIEGLRYDLQEFHFHSPSEHKIDGVSHDIELHLTHKNAAGALVVVAVFFNEGHENAALRPLIANLPSHTKGDEKGPLAFDLNALLPTSTVFFQYPGSLTEPPCSEKVQWYVLKQPQTGSTKQIDALTTLLGFNARPVQPLYERSIQQSTR